MPVGENVSEEMALKFKDFLRESYEDYTANRSRATLRGLIISLYETAKVVCTLDKDINKGPANYKYLKCSLPVEDNVLALEKVRNDLVHNYQKVEDVIISVYKAVESFGKQNLDYLAKVCELPALLYEDIIGFCTAYVRRTTGNTPVQGNTSGFMSDIINGINPNRR